MKKVITYGTYDLLHQGHINLLRRAKELGDYLIVGVTSDSFDRERGKLNVRNNVLERIEAVRQTGYADEIVIEDYVGQKIDDIQRFGVDIFAIGSDWQGHFDYLKEFCQVVYLPRTEGIFLRYAVNTQPDKTLSDNQNVLANQNLWQIYPRQIAEYRLFSVRHSLLLQFHRHIRFAVRLQYVPKHCYAH